MDTIELARNVVKEHKQLLEALERLLSVERMIRKELRLLTEDDVDRPYENQPLDAWNSAEEQAELAISTAKAYL